MKRCYAGMSALCAAVLLSTPGFAAAQPMSSPSPMMKGSPNAMSSDDPSTGNGNGGGMQPMPDASGASAPMSSGTPMSSMKGSHGMSSQPMHNGGMMRSSMSASSMGGDSTFVTMAAQGGMTEVKAARIALQKSSSPKVKAFAQKMIADHTPNNAKLASIVKGEGKMVPMSVGAMHQAELTKLQGLSGSAFDQAYWSGQIADHKKMLALMQHEATSGSDPKLVAFAKMTAPTVQMHLSLAQKDMNGAM